MSQSRSRSSSRPQTSQGGRTKKSASQARPQSSLGRAPKISTAAPKISNSRPQTSLGLRTDSSASRSISKTGIRSYYQKPNTTCGTTSRASSAAGTRPVSRTSCVFGTTNKAVKEIPAPSALSQQLAAKLKGRSKRTASKRADKMSLNFHCDDNNSLRVKTCRWQSTFVTEKTKAPSEYRFRDFEDYEKDLTRMVRNFHTDNSLDIQMRASKNQSDLRDVKPPAEPKSRPIQSGSMELVFKPLDPMEELSTREKAYHKSVHLESVDKHAKEIEQSKLKQNWTHCWDLVEKPRDRFVKYHQTIRTSDKMKDLGLQRGGYFLPE